MTATRVGRNDPCPCGSGKKYKYCCLRKDKRRRRARVTSSAPRTPQQPDDLPGQIRYITQQLKSHKLVDEAPELRQTLKKLEQLARFEVMRDEIEAASLNLEAHRGAFEEMMADAPAAIERAHRLFSEERFASMRYSADDLDRAFEAVGYPSPFMAGPGEDEMKTMVDATLHLAGDMENRERLAQQLLMALPEYVAAGRYRDAWLIQHSAYLMTQSAERSNPFLFVMYELAFEEWARQANEEHEALLQELGVDPSAIRELGVQEMEALVEQLMADPRAKARLEAFYEANPELGKRVTAELIQLEHEAFGLLDRDDVERLTLSPEEVEPWLPVLVERLGALVPQVREAAEQGEQPDPEIIRAMEEQMVEVTQEMAPAIYTPARIDQLVANLDDYRRTLEKAGEREAAASAHSALMFLKRDIPPAGNRFLVALCFASLRGVMRTAADAAAAAREESEGLSQTAD